MRTIVLLALVLAAPAHAQAPSQASSTAPPPSPIRVGRGVTLIPQGAAPLAAPPKRPDHLLRVTGAPEAPASLANKDTIVLSAPITHAVTGELTAPVQRFGDWMSGIRPVPVGTKFYATQLGGMQVWCAPERAKNGRWGATCYHPSTYGRWTQASVVSDGLFVTAAQERTSGVIQPPLIAAMPHDFGEPMRLVYRFKGWNKQAAALETYVEHDGGGSRITSVSAPRGRDGSARLEALGSELRLLPAGPNGKEATVEVVRLAETIPTSPY